MNRVRGLFGLIFFCAALAVNALAADAPAVPVKFKLLSGEVLEGEPISPTDRGVIIRLVPEGKLSARIAWTNFTQEALKELVKNPKAKSIAELFIVEAPDDDIDTSLMPVLQRRERAPIKLLPVEKPERYSPRPGFCWSVITSWFGWVTMLLIYGANLYAAYEVAIYRRRPVKTVVGLAAIPFAGPGVTVAFLCLPEVKEAKAAPPSAAIDNVKEEEIKGPAPKSMHKGPAGKPAHGGPPPASDAPTMVQSAPAAPAIPKTQYFRRGEVSFNRRFVETKFAPFFKMVLADKEKDLFLVFNTLRGQFVTQRVVKVSQTDVVVQIEVESATCEETFAFNDIQEVQIRHREAQD